MGNRKRGIGLLGLLVVVALGAMALAASAQALTSEFLIAKKLPVAGLNATVTGAPEAGAVNALLTPALNTAINCTAFTIAEGIVLDSKVAHGKLLFEGCTVLSISTKEELPCNIVVTHTGDKRHHITATASVLPAELKDGTQALLAEKIAAVILTEEGTGCVLPKTTQMKGEVCIKIAAGTNDTLEPLVLSDATIQGECQERTALEGATIGAGFKDKVLFGAQESFVDLKATLKLTGAHAGLTLGVSLQ